MCVVKWMLRHKGDAKFLHTRRYTDVAMHASGIHY